MGFLIVYSKELWRVPAGLPVHAHITYYALVHDIVFVAGSNTDADLISNLSFAEYLPDFQKNRLIPA